MNSKETRLKVQLLLVVALRFMIGCHLLIKGITQIIHPEWPSLAFLLDSKENMTELSLLITSNLNVLCAADFLITWVLIILGLGLILGIYSRRAVFAGAVVLGLYYLVLPASIGLAIGLPQEGNYSLVNPDLLVALALILISIASVAKKFGLNALFDCKIKPQILSNRYELKNRRTPDIRRAHQESLSYPLTNAS